MPVCSACGKPNRDHARFCGYCGRPLQQPAPREPAGNTEDPLPLASTATGRTPRPGWRSRIQWQQLLSVCGYGSSVLILLAGAACDDAALLLVGAEALALLLLAANAWGVRSRVPLLNSDRPLTVALGWGILLVLGGGALGAVLAPTLPAAFTAAALAPTESQGRPTAELLRPRGQYKDYAFSRDTASFDPEDPKSKTLLKGRGLLPLIREKGDGFVSIYAASAQTELKVPLGWYVADTGKETQIFSPDQKLRFILRFADAEVEDFSQAKQQIRREVQQAFASQPRVRLHELELPDGSFALQVANIRTESGNTNSFLNLFTPNPRKPRYPLSFSFTAPAAQFERYLGLMGLMLRDRRITWEQSSMEEFLDLRQRSQAFDPVKRLALEKLVRGELEAVVQLLSPTLVTQTGAERIREQLATKTLPFFAEFAAWGKSTVVAPAVDQFGHQGFAYYEHFLTKDGQQKPFVLYLVQEGGRIVLANILANTTYEGLHRGKTPGN